MTIKLLCQSLQFHFFQQVTCDDVVDELRQVFRQFVDRAVYLDCLLVDQDACYAALKDRELPYVDEEQESKGKKSRKDGRRFEYISYAGFL